MEARAREPVTLPAFLDGLAARFGEREALVSPRRRVTYAELAAEATAIARALAARGVEAGTRVGLLMPNWPEWIATAFGVWRAGGLLVPLSTLSRPREMEYCLAHAEVRVLVAVRRFLRHDYVAGLEESLPRLPALGEVVWLAPPGEGGAVDLAPLGAPGSPLAATVSPDDPATVFFTSGTTAEPKGVVHVHRALCRAAEDIAAVLGIAPEDRTWGYLPFFFAGGLVAVVLATLARGGAVVMQEVFEPGETLRLLEAERCTFFFAWPHQAEVLIAHPRFRAARLVLRNGVGANTKWAAALYPPDHHAVGTYGMTETLPLCTAWPWHAPLALRAASHGPPVGGKALRIGDPASGRTPPPAGWRRRPSPRKSFSPTAAPGSRATRSRATSGSGARTSCPRSRAARWTRRRCARRRRAWSEPAATVPQLRQHGGGERHVGVRGVVAHEERVGDARRVVALDGEGELPLLQRAGHVHLGHQAHEGGAGVGRQLLLGARVERHAVEARALGEHEGGHAGAAVLARHLHAVHVRLRDPGRAAEDVGDLLRGDVLALPAEGVADAIDEVVVAVGVLAQQIPGAEPGVAAREGVAHELPLAR